VLTESWAAEGLIVLELVEDMVGVGVAEQR
jgi:hypothetical protein